MPTLLMIDGAMLIGVRTLGLGMLMVLGIIAVLYAILKLLIPLFSAISRRSSDKNGTVTEPAPVAAAPVASECDESETVAAIIAAISAYEGKSPDTFRVVSYKRI